MIRSIVKSAADNALTKAAVLPRPSSCSRNYSKNHPAWARMASDALAYTIFNTKIVAEHVSLCKFSLAHAAHLEIEDNLNQTHDAYVWREIKRDHCERCLDGKTSCTCRRKIWFVLAPWIFPAGIHWIHWSFLSSCC